MSQITLTEAQTELTRVNIAIQDLIEGKKIDEHKFSTSEFSRWYKFSVVNLESLRDYRNELRNIINGLSPEVTPVFRQNACIPLFVRKGVC